MPAQQRQSILSGAILHGGDSRHLNRLNSLGGLRGRLQHRVG